MQRPRLRTDLDFIPFDHQGQQAVLVRDPLGLTPEGLTLAPALLNILLMMDGRTELRALQLALMRQQGGRLVTQEELGRLISQLDESYLLDSRRYRSAYAAQVERFARSPVRRAALCGKAYPGDPEQLRSYLNEILALAGKQKTAPRRLIALIAPHIDIKVGKELYAGAYRRLKGARPGRVIVLGIGHQIRTGLFCLTAKDFETPLGIAPTDRRAVERLLQADPSLLCESDFPHRDEHSVEFQVLWLQHLLPPGSFSLVPILCGPLRSSLDEYSRQEYLRRAGLFLKALAELSAVDTETLLVAGVDFSHIGPKFGHPHPAAAMEPRARQHDHRLLKALETGDAEELWCAGRQADDVYNVCGFPALACLLEIITPGEGHLLGYRMWHEAATSSAVSFAALAFESSA